MTQHNYDPYAVCPCGSGKKLKFCCANVADDMIRVERLQNTNQHRAAFQLLEKTCERAPGNPWVVQTYVFALLEDGHIDKATETLQKALQLSPEQDEYLVLLATCGIERDGFLESRKLLQRAFQKGSKKNPAMVARLAHGVADELFDQGNPLGGRVFLGLAMRWASPDYRETLFNAFMRIDSHAGMELPLRGVNQAPPLPAGAPFDRDLQTAAKFASIGCFGAACDILQSHMETLADSAAAWHTLGLWRAAWHDLEAAAAALHRAAAIYAASDFEVAVDCETQAQLIESDVKAPTVNMAVERSEISGSVSQLISRLAEQPLLQRGDAAAASQPFDPSVSMFTQIDRPQLVIDDKRHVAGDDIPIVLGRIFFFDGDNAGIVLVAMPDKIDALRAIVVDQAAAIGVALTFGPVDRRHAVGPDTFSLLDFAAFPQGVCERDARRIRRAFVERNIIPKWLESPRVELGDRSPQQLQGDSSQAVALAAAINVLQAQAECRKVWIDRDAMRSRLGAPAVAPLLLRPEESIQSLSFQQLARIDVAQLTRDQLISAVQRASLSRSMLLMGRLADRVLSEAEVLTHVGAFELVGDMMTVSLGIDDGASIPSYLAVLEKLPTREGDSEFQRRFRLDSQRLALLLDDPFADESIAMLRDYRRKYAAKAPDVVERVRDYFVSRGYQSLWDETSDMPFSLGAAPVGKLWTPDSVDPAPAGAGALWVPGS